MNCQLKQAACSSGCETVFPPVHLTDPKIDVWPHDFGPDTQSEGCVSRRYERSCSTQTFLPSEGFIARTVKRSVGKVRGPQPGLPRECPCPLAGYLPHGCVGYAAVRFPPQAKPGGFQRGHW